VAEGGVLVRLQLGIPGDDPAVARHHQRVDLGSEGVLLGDRPVELADDLGQGRRVLAEPGLEREPPQLEVERSAPGVRVELGDRLRRVLGNRLDVHPTLGREHQDVGAVVSIDGEAEVDLLGDVERALAVDERHLEALDVHADDRLGGGPRLLRRLGELDAPRLAPAADGNLRFDRDRPDLPGCLGRLVRCPGHLSRRYGDAEGGEDLLGLVLEQLHSGPPPA